ncbi:MAG: hypothetical protein BGN87_11540 [Rhizobiales bacterium 65-79]|nr:hypothetical protein [Hyphomicrobiales bacterium]OJU07144.1 MAG: hypothetical protein BGN87_11540 [Rhizobiales bacterium 65-79]
MGFVLRPGDIGGTPDPIRQKLAEAMLAQGIDTSPVQSWTQGAARLANALVGGLMERQLRADEKNNASTNSLLLENMLGGAGAFPAAPGSPQNIGGPSQSPATDYPSQRVASAFAASGGDGTMSPQTYFGPDVDISKLPAGMRNNNPGNIKFVGQNVPGIVGPSQNTDQGDPQAVFASPLAGMQAAASLARRKNQGGKRTINELIAGPGGWTPGNTQAAANIATTMGISPNVDIDLGNPAMMQRFLRGLVTQEHGPASKLYSDDLIAKAANGSPPPNGGVGADPSMLAVAGPSPAFNFYLTAGQKAAVGGGQMSDADALKAFGASAYAPGSMASIVAGLSNPAASATTRQVASTLLGSQMKANSPEAKLDLQLKQAQLNALQNPTKAPTVQQFFDPQTGQPYAAQWNPQTKSWDKVGGNKIPANGLTVTLADGTVIQQGGKAGGDPQAKQTASDVITNAASKIRDLSKSFGSTGLLGAAESYLPNTNAAEIYRQVGVLKSNASIEALNAMRQQSKTGGALGSVTEREEAMLAAKAGALDPKSPYFQTQLDDYERTLLRIVHGKDAGDAIYNSSRQQAAGPTDAPKIRRWNPATGELE